MSKLFSGLRTTSAMTFAVLLVGAYQAASAGADSINPQPAPNLEGTEAATPGAVAKGHVLVKTYIHSGESSASLSPGVYTPIDSKTTISCPKDPCTIFAHMLVQAGGYTASNASTLVLYLDGSQADNLFFVGLVPDGNYANLTQDTQVNNVATGNHTVQMYFESVNVASLAHFAATYTVYEP